MWPPLTNHIIHQAYTKLFINLRQLLPKILEAENGLQKLAIKILLVLNEQNAPCRNIFDILSSSENRTQ